VANDRARTPIKIDKKNEKRVSALLFFIESNTRSYLVPYHSPYIKARGSSAMLAWFTNYQSSPYSLKSASVSAPEAMSETICLKA